MDELENFSTWCRIVGDDLIQYLQDKIEKSYEELRKHCHEGKWHAMNVTVSTVVRDDQIVHILTAQLVKVEFLQRQQIQQSLNPNNGLRRV